MQETRRHIKNKLKALSKVPFETQKQRQESARNLESASLKFWSGAAGFVASSVTCPMKNRSSKRFANLFKV